MSQPDKRQKGPSPVTGCLAYRLSFLRCLVQVSSWDPRPVLLKQGGCEKQPIVELQHPALSRGCS